MCTVYFETYGAKVCVNQLLLEQWPNPAIRSKNELGNCNAVKNWEIIILPILALNSKKKEFLIVFQNLIIFRGHVKVWPSF